MAYIQWNNILYCPIVQCLRVQAWGCLCMQVSDKGMSCLQGLVRLRRLGLQGTGVTSSSMPVLGAFSELEALDIAWTSIDSHGMLLGTCMC